MIYKKIKFDCYYLGLPDNLIQDSDALTPEQQDILAGAVTAGVYELAEMPAPKLDKLARGKDFPKSKDESTAQDSQTPS